MEVKRSDHIKRTPSAVSTSSISAAVAGTSMDCGPAMDYPSLDIIFEFFSDNPQKMKPRNEGTSSVNGSSNSNSGLSPGGGGGGTSASPHLLASLDEQPNTSRYIVDPYWESIRLMQQTKEFMEGMLLRSVDYKPRYPYVHYIVSKSMPNNENISEKPNTRTPSSYEGGNNGGMSSKYGIGNETLKRQACLELPFCSGQGHNFNELYTFVDRETPLLPKRPSNPNTAFIVSAFKALGSLESLDKTWSYWSGADYIVECIPKTLKLERVTFHKVKEYHHEKDSFAYVLLCEIGEALSDMNRTREFIDTLKYRQCGVTSLYLIDHFF